MFPVTRNGCSKDIQVAGEKYGSIEGLGNEGNAFGTPVRVYRPNQNQL